MANEQSLVDRPTLTVGMQLWGLSCNHLAPQDLLTFTRPPAGHDAHLVSHRQEFRSALLLAGPVRRRAMTLSSTPEQSVSTLCATWTGPPLVVGRHGRLSNMIEVRSGVAGSVQDAALAAAEATASAVEGVAEATRRVASRARGAASATRKGASTARKTAASKTAASKTAASKTAASKTGARKAPARKTGARKAPARKTAARKAPARKTAAQRTTARRTTARKSLTRKSTARRGTNSGGPRRG